MYQCAGWHYRSEPLNHYRGDDISAKLSTSLLEAVAILPEGGPTPLSPNVLRERICRIMHSTHV